jgi:hypothetical protein
MQLTKEQLSILQHALGLDEFGQGRMYRNQFCAAGRDEDICRSLVELGLMRQHVSTEVFPYYNCTVTNEGKAAVIEQSPKPPKLTRSQKRYRHFLNWADAYDGSFREYLEVLKQRKVLGEVGE